MRVNEHTAYKKARALSSLVWEVTRSWDRNTYMILGNQLIRSTDSISANLAEGWNKYKKRDKCNFFIIARGSTAETSDWIEKAKERSLISQNDFDKALQLLKDLPKEINGLIKGTNQNLKV